jgi:Rieske Fe-S protein
MDQARQVRTISSVSRRDFLLVVAGLGAITGCAAEDSGNPAEPRVVNAGPAANFASDGVYTNFRESGFFVVRDGTKLSALSAICTHKKCKLSAEPDRSFYCPCHGSIFAPDGRVMTGPAKRDLPRFPAVVNEQGQLLVTVSGV